MLKGLKLSLLMLSIVFITFACSDNDKETNKPTTCKETCQEWEECKDGVCVLADNRCNSDADCSTEKPVCDTATHMCKTNTSACTENETKCEGSNLLTCTNEAWVTTNCADSNKTCKVENNSASCVEESTTTCTENETKCEGNNLLTCTNEAWVTTNCSDEGKVCKTENNNASCIAEGPQELTIPEIKALTASSTVITTGKVTHITMYDNKVAGFYMQESQNNFGAIYVFIKNGVHSSLKLGNTVKVTGLALPKFGVVRIGDNDNIPSFEITDNSEELVAVKSMASTEVGLEQVDMLVKITNTEFTVKSLGEAPMYHTIITDGNDNEFIINSKFYRFNEEGLTVGSLITKLEGIVGSYENDDLTYKFLVRPRTADDLAFNNEGTEGQACRTTDPACNEGLKCVNNVCEVRLPCDNACTETQYCNEETDACVDLTLQPISEVRALTEDKRVMVEGVVTQTKKHNQTTATYYLQDATTPFSGIQIYFKNAATPSISIGDRVRVIGLATDYQGFIEIGTADDQPEITVLESDVPFEAKSIAATDITEENLYIYVELQNPPFTVKNIEVAHPKYVTLKDSLGNEFLLNNDWISDNEFFYSDDVLTELRGVISYRYSNGITITINPRTMDDFLFQGE